MTKILVLCDTEVINFNPYMFPREVVSQTFIDKV